MSAIQQTAIQQSVKPRGRRSGKGENTAKEILLAAEDLLIDEGYANFSLRKVAARAEQTLGSLQYHFPTKNALIKAMLDNCIQTYLELFARIRADAGDDPEDQFAALVRGVVDDLNSEWTTMFFPEVWSLSNHHEHAAEFLDAMYGQYRSVLIEVIKQINPSLSTAQLKRLAVFISASLEGHTIFVGHRKPWQKESDNVVTMATESFLWLIHSGRIPT